MPLRCVAVLHEEMSTMAENIVRFAHYIGNGHVHVLITKLAGLFKMVSTIIRMPSLPLLIHERSVRRTKNFLNLYLSKNA